MMFNKIYLGLGATILVSLPFNYLQVKAETIRFTETSSHIQKYLVQNPERKKDDELGDEKFIEKLNLTADQKQKIQVIRQKYQPEIQQTHQSLRAEKSKLREMMVNNQSSDQMRNQHRKIVALNQKLNNLRFESMLEIREVLTAQQRQDFASMMEKRKNGRRGNPNP